MLGPGCLLIEYHHLQSLDEDLAHFNGFKAIGADSS